MNLQNALREFNLNYSICFHHQLSGMDKTACIYVYVLVERVIENVLRDENRFLSLEARDRRKGEGMRAVEFEERKEKVNKIKNRVKNEVRKMA